MNVKRLGKFAACALAAGFACVPVAAQAPDLAMLNSLQRGGWVVKNRSDGTDERICVRTGREFIQLRHGTGNCDRFIVQDDASEVTVQYTCRGNGYGRTTIRREGNGLVQIQSTGFIGGKPFSMLAEARHAGAC